MNDINGVQFNNIGSDKLLEKGQQLAGKKVLNEKDRAEMEKAAKEFEQMFVSYVFSTVRESLGKDSLINGGEGEQMFGPMLDQEYSRQLSESGSLGLSEMIMRQYSDTGVAGIQQERHNPYKGCKPSDGCISSEYGVRKHPIFEDLRFHHGLDIAGAEGSSVKAFRDGKVVFSGEMPGYGNMVIVRHSNNLETRYAHNKENLVNEGDTVKAGQEIAKIGSTGSSTGPHLHFEVRKNGQSVNPKIFL